MTLPMEEKSMLSWLLPKEGNYFELFDKHGKLCVQSAEILVDVFQKKTSTAIGALKIKELEHQADDILQQCFSDLHRTFVTPIDRDQIFALISKMDDIIDDVESVANELYLYEISRFNDRAPKFASLLLSGIKEIASGVSLLRNMNNGPEIIHRCIAARKFEKEGDSLLREALSELFKKGLDPLYMIQWKEIFDSLERGLDNCQEASNIIEGIILEYS